MSVLEHGTWRLTAQGLPRVARDGFRAWRARRRMQRLARLASRQLAGLSAHMLSDIGVAAPERDRSVCLRLWTGGGP